MRIRTEVGGIFYSEDRIIGMDAHYHPNNFFNDRPSAAERITVFQGDNRNNAGSVVPTARGRLIKMLQVIYKSNLGHRLTLSKINN